MEEWKVFKISEYKDNRGKARWGKRIYEVSDLGRCRINGEIYEPIIHDGYLGFHGKRIHRIVAELFIPNPENKPCVDHINGDKHDNRAVNLRWTTYKENNENPVTRNKFLSTVRSSEYREMVSNRMHKRYEDEEERKKVGERNKAFFEKHPEARQRVIDMNNKRWSNIEEHIKASERMKGDNNPMRRKKLNQQNL